MDGGEYNGINMYDGYDSYDDYEPPCKRNTDTSFIATCKNKLFSAAKFVYDSIIRIGDRDSTPSVPVTVERDDVVVSQLHIAASGNNMFEVSLSLNCGADINVVDLWGSTPLYRACRYNNFALAKILYNSGADIVSAKIDLSPVSMPVIDADYLFICKLYYSNTYIAKLPSDIIVIIITICKKMIWRREPLCILLTD